jgi:hypothetical protein
MESVGSTDQIWDPTTQIQLPVTSRVQSKTSGGQYGHSGKTWGTSILRPVFGILIRMSGLCTGRPNHGVGWGKGRGGYA